MEALKERPELTTLIKSVSQKEGIYDYKIVDVQTNQKGEGYLGQIFMVTVKDSTNDKQLEMVIKAAFEDEKIRTMVPIRMSFENEIYFYSELYPKFENFEKKFGVRNIAQIVPRCLMVSKEMQHEMLALENLKNAGFEVFDKKLILDHDHIKIIFETYGKFHAYSFALQDQCPEEYTKISEGLYNIFAEFMKKNLFADHFKEINKIVENIFIPGEDDELIKKYENYSGSKLSDIFKSIVDETFDYSTIIHGDCWSNNMLFKYEDVEDNRKPSEMRLIDFQIVRVASPVLDLSYCLYSGASKEIFDNLNYYLEIYYDSFSTFLKKLGSDPKELFPFSVLQEHWRKYAKFGMIMAFSIVRMKMTDKDDIIDLTDGYEMDEFVSAFTNTRYSQDEYEKRIKELLWHMCEIDAL